MNRDKISDTMSQNKYNIIFNPPELTSEQINKHKSFEELMAKLETAAPPVETPRVVQLKPWRRRLLYAASVGAAAMIALVLYLGTGQENMEHLVANKLAAMPYVNPQLMEMQKEFASFKLDGTTGGVYEYESGSKVTVPANAFVDNAGKTVTGEVEFQYREFHDCVDFFLAGIPMGYDSASRKYLLESAGMIEIKAFQNGQPISIHPKKALDIELVSTIDFNPKHQYSVYQLNETDRNWNYKEIDRIEPIFTGALKMQMDKYLTAAGEAMNVDGQNLATINQKIAVLNAQQTQALTELESTVEMPAAPIKPQKSEPTDLITDFKYEATDAHSEITAFEKKYGALLWVAAPSQAENLKIATSNIEWDDVNWRKIPNSPAYEVVLTSTARKELKLTLKPVLNGTNYQKAMADYETQKAAFEMASAARNEKLQAQKTAIVEKTEQDIAALQQMKVSLEGQLAAYRQKGYNRLVSETLLNQKIINRFKITDVGIWNCSRPLPTNLTSLKATFENTDKKPLEFLNGYLVNKKQNTVAHFLTTGDKPIDFQYFNEDENLMWVVGTNGELSVVYPEKFSGINKNTKEHNFLFETVNKPIQSEAELRTVLGIEK